MELDRSSPVEVFRDSGTPLAFVVMFSIGLACALVLVPMSRQGADADGAGLEVLSSMKELFKREQPADRSADAKPASTAAAPVPLAVPDNKPSQAGPFDVPILAALKGRYCSAYMPDGDDKAAREAFAELVWDKLDPDVRTKVSDRLDVCFPFSAVNDKLVKAGGCRKSECTVNDVHFYIDIAGKAAVEYRVDGECNQASEEGFSQARLLCAK